MWLCLSRAVHHTRTFYDIALSKFGRAVHHTHTHSVTALSKFGTAVHHTRILHSYLQPGFVQIQYGTHPHTHSSQFSTAVNHTHILPLPDVHTHILHSYLQPVIFSNSVGQSTTHTFFIVTYNLALSKFSRAVHHTHSS